MTMFIAPNLSPEPGTSYAADYRTLNELYSRAFNTRIETPSATYWPHTLVPTYFRLKLLDVEGFGEDLDEGEEPIEGVPPLLINLATAACASAYWPTIVMVQMLYADRSEEEILDIVESFRGSEEDLERVEQGGTALAILKWARKFVQTPSEMTADDLSALEAFGLSHPTVSGLVQRASVQHHFAICCSAAGIDDLASFAYPLRSIIDRDGFSSRAPDNLTGAPGTVADTDRLISTQASWLHEAERPLDDPIYDPVKSALGSVPNLFKAASVAPKYFARHLYALKLLEAPQTPELSPRHHAMIRHLSSVISGSAYFLPQTTEYLRATTQDDILSDRIENWRADANWSAEDKAVLSLCEKMTCHAYKITQSDVDEVCRLAAWSDIGYCDFYETIAIQTSLCRLAHGLGVTPDGGLSG